MTENEIEREGALLIAELVPVTMRIMSLLAGYPVSLDECTNQSIEIQRREDMSESELDELEACGRRIEVIALELSRLDACRNARSLH